MSSNAIAKTETSRAMSPIATVRDMLTKMKDQIQMALPNRMTADRMIRVALTSVQKNPALLECDVISLCGAVVQAAQLGLEVDDGTGKAYLIPFWNGKKKRKEVQFMAGYKGLVDLARRSGEIRMVMPQTVYEKDTFDYDLGLDRKLIHKPTREAEKGKAIFYYAVAEFKDGGKAAFDVMSVPDVEEIHKQVKEKNRGNDGAWATHYDEMAMKTVIRRLCKYLPSSPELQKAIHLDERNEIGLPQDLGMLVDPTEKGSENAEALQEPQAVDAAPAKTTPKGPVIGKPERDKIRELLDDHGLDLKMLDKYLFEAYGWTGDENIPMSEYQAVCKWITEPQADLPNG